MSIYSSEIDIFSQKIRISPINIPKSYLLFRTSFNTATFRGTDLNNSNIIPSLSVDFSSPNVFEKSSELKSANIYSDKHLFPINNIPMSVSSASIACSGHSNPILPGEARPSWSTNNWQFSEITQLSIYTPIKTPLRINNKHRSIQKKVNFETKYNKIIIIQGLSFYNENNIKKDIWWSTTELNNMRQMVTNEINRMKRLHPHWSVTQCIQELYRIAN